MAIKDKFRNTGLYRLWVVLFWLWVGGFVFLGGFGETKKAYRDYEEQKYCEQINQDRLCVSLAPASERAKVPHNPLVLLFWVVGALIGPPYALYYFYRIVRWVGQGFSTIGS